MTRKKVTELLPLLVDAAAASHHRALVVLVGDKSKYQVVHLHRMLTIKNGKKPSVLWCYKTELGFSSHRKKRAKQIKKSILHGQYNENVDDPFENFVTATEIRYCYYKDTHQILGKTYGMCVLQDFESLTPNILCRTIETVQGGGLILLLLKSISSLTQLYNCAMDSHKKYKTPMFQDVVPRFNERFILSLTDCDHCLIMDDELNELPLCKRFSGTLKSVKPLTSAQQAEALKNPELTQLIESMSDINHLNKIASSFVTMDQAQCVSDVFSVLKKMLGGSVVAITAGRGRGKSAALGFCTALALELMFTNVFVTAPTPENCSTVFEFTQRALDMMGYKENEDYSLTLVTPNQAANIAGKSANKLTVASRINIPTIIRIDVNKGGRRRSMQFIYPDEHQYLLQADLLVIDEAAAIPLPRVKKLLGSHITLMASTVNGYEGTGRALSLKLLNELKNRSGGDRNGNSSFSEIKLEEPIRYFYNDPIESWLRSLLCLDATQPSNLSSNFILPPDSQCKLFRVNRSSLFSYHKTAETFLGNLISLFVSSHYKNTPNDLLLMADSPSHEVFVLVPPLDSSSASELPPALAAIQVCIEGGLVKHQIEDAARRGLKPSGDLVPWTVGEHFTDDSFGSLTGVRVVRIAVHPAFFHRGYGSSAMRQLIQYYSKTPVPVGLLTLNDENNKVENSDSSKLQEEVITARNEIPPLFEDIDEISPPYSIDYISTSFGLTNDLFKFWSRLNFTPVYLRQTANDVTGEFSTIMISPLHDSCPWLVAFNGDFKSRFISLLGGCFSTMNTELARSVLFGYNSTEVKSNSSKPCLSDKNICEFLTEHDLLRLQKYTCQLADRSLILDLIPILASLYLDGRFSIPDLQHPVQLSRVQAACLIAVGCQRKSFDSLAQEYDYKKISVEQFLSQFQKTVAKLYHCLVEMKEAAVRKEIEERMSSAYESVRGVNQLQLEKKEKENSENNGDCQDVEETETKKQKQKIVGNLLKDPSLGKLSMENVDLSQLQGDFDSGGKVSVAVGSPLKKRKDKSSHIPKSKKFKNL